MDNAPKISTESNSQMVKAYAKNHPIQNVVTHAGPVFGMGTAILSLSLLGLGPIVVPIVVVLGILAMVLGFNNFNRLAMREDNHDIAHNGEIIAERKVKALMSSTDVVREKYTSEYDCKNYEQVTFELKLVDEGVISIQDVSVCEDGGKLRNWCLLCMPIKKRQKADRERVEQEERDKRQREYEKSVREARRRQEKRARERDSTQLAEMDPHDAKRVKAWFENAKKFNPEFEQVEIDQLLDSAHITKRRAYLAKCAKCQKCTHETWYINMCPQCRLDQLNADKEKARLDKIAATKAEKARVKAEKERIFEERRHVELNGLHLVRPLAVPEGAVPSLLHGREIDPLATHSFIVWKWTEDGKTSQFYKQPVIADEYSVSTGDKSQPVSTWHAVTDPETGGHLGDYRTVNGKADTSNLVGNSEFWHELRRRQMAGPDR